MDGNSMREALVENLKRMRPTQRENGGELPRQRGSGWDDALLPVASEVHPVITPYLCNTFILKPVWVGFLLPATKRVLTNALPPPASILWFSSGVAVMISCGSPPAHEAKTSWEASVPLPLVLFFSQGSPGAVIQVRVREGRTSLAVQWLRLRICTAGGAGSVPAQGTKNPQAVGCSQTNNNSKIK